MKNRPIFTLVLLAAFAWFCAPATGIAQGDPAPTSKPSVVKTSSMKTKQPAPSPKVSPNMYCDKVIPKTNEQMLVKANSECRTVKMCVPCTERTSSTQIYATLVVQPSAAAKCKNSVAAVSNEMTDDSGKPLPAEAQPPFLADIMQSVCTAKGVTLEVFFPAEQDVRPGDYQFLWELDNGKGGHDRRIDCACGNTAKVRITQAATGKSVTKVVRLMQACDPPAKD